MLASIAVLLVAMVPFFARFERKQLQAREVVLLAMLVAIAAVSRVPFAAVPSIQPMTFVIIVTAISFGAESGFIVGALAALVSNMFLGHGPWTPWQMFTWGMVGLTAGMLKDTGWFIRRPVLLAFGFIWGLLFGWIMNLSMVPTLFQSVFSWKALMAVYAAGFYFDLLHALANVFFLAVFGGSWVKIMLRFKKKYGLF